MPMVLCERVRRHILCQFDAVSNQLVMGFHVYGMHLQLKSYQFCLSLLQFEGLTMQKIKGLAVKRWELLQRGFGQYYSIRPPHWLFTRSHFARFPTDFLRLIRTNCHGSPSLFNNQPVPIGFLFVIDRVIGVSTQQFNSIAAKLAKYMPKHPFLRTFLMVKHDAINPPRPSRPLISHN
jgi:hypothetical protein